MYKYLFVPTILRPATGAVIKYKVSWQLSTKVPKVVDMLGCGPLLFILAAASADRLTYLNLLVDTALMHVTLPSTSPIPGGQYGPRVSIFVYIYIARSLTSRMPCLQQNLTSMLQSDQNPSMWYYNIAFDIIGWMDRI